MASTRTARTHLPWTAIIVPLLLFLCVTPLATAGGGWIVMYVLPAFALLAVVAGGTTATATHLSARWLRGRTRLAWDEVQQLEFPGQNWAVAVTTSGARVVLPGVRPSDLPRIVAAAGGRLFLQRRVTTDDDENADSTENAANTDGTDGTENTENTEDVQNTENAETTDTTERAAAAGSAPEGGPHDGPVPESGTDDGPTDAPASAPEPGSTDETAVWRRFGVG